MPMEFVFIIGMAVLLILCVKVKANAFISLLATALVMGLLSGMSGADTVAAITGGFSGTVKSIGIVIIFGIMLGNYLDAAKGTNRMALDAVRLVGQKRAGLAMAITGYLVSIPVFSDAAFVILTPLVKAIHKKTRISLAILAVSLSAGLLSTHVFVPPTPGPLAAAGLLGIDIGRAILYGAFGAVFMTLAGWIFAEIYFRNKPDSYYSFRDEEEQKKDEALSIEDDTDLPGTLASLLPLVVPILLILLNTTCGMMLPEDSPVMTIVSFVGDSNIALAIGAVLAIITLGKRLGGKVKRRRSDRLHHLCRRRAWPGVKGIRSRRQPGPDGIKHWSPLHPDSVCDLRSVKGGAGFRYGRCNYRCNPVRTDRCKPWTGSDPDLPCIRSRRTSLLPRKRQLLLGIHKLYGI